MRFVMLLPLLFCQLMWGQEQPDLKLDLFSSALDVQAGELVNLPVRVQNLGVSDARTFVLTISVRSTEENGFQWELFRQQLAIGDQNSIQNLQAALQFPAFMPSGAYRLEAWADPTRVIFESNEGNNYVEKGVTIRNGSTTPLPDLVVEDLVWPRNIYQNHPIDARIRIKNIGAAKAENIGVGLYLSEDNLWDQTDVLIGTLEITELLAGGVLDNQFFEGLDGALPMLQALQRGRHLIVRANLNDAIPESNNTNNFLERYPYSPNYIQVYPANGVNSVADLSIHTTASNLSLEAGRVLELPIEVTNRGGRDYSGSYTVEVELMPRGADAPNFQRVLTTLPGPNLRAGEVRRLNSNIPIPNGTPSGDYFVAVRLVIANNTQRDNSDTNNEETITTVVDGTMEQFPDLRPLRLEYSYQQRIGRATQVRVDVENSGIAADAFDMKLYLSADQNLDVGDLLLDTKRVLGIEAMDTLKGIAFENVFIPNNYAEGRYSLILVVDTEDSVSEGNEENNVLIRAVQLSNSRLVADLAVNTTLDFDQTVQAGQEIDLEILCGNFGQVAANGYFLEVIIQQNRTFSGSSVGFRRQLLFIEGPSLNPNEQKMIQHTIRIPDNAPAGDYRFDLQINPQPAQIEEDNRNNNFFFKGLRIANEQSVALPDLNSQIFLDNNRQVVAGEQLAGRILLRNRSEVAIDRPFTVVLAFSKNQYPSEGEEFILATYRVTERIEAGGELNLPYASHGNNPVIPRTAMSGQHFLSVSVDTENEIEELDEYYNTSQSTITILPPTQLDLQIQQFLFQQEWVVGNRYNPYISYIGTQQNPTATICSKLYFSSDQVLDEDDRLLAHAPSTGFGGSFSTRANFRQVSCDPNSQFIPVIAPDDLPDGTYYLIAVLDAENAIAEADETNNQAIGQISLTRRPDIELSAIGFVHDSIQPTFLPGDTVQLSYQVITRTVDVPAVKMQLIINPLFSGQVLGSYIHELPALAANQTYDLTYSFVLTDSMPTNYYNINAHLDYNNQVIESNEGNNRRVASMIVDQQLDIVSVSCPTQHPVAEAELEYTILIQNNTTRTSTPIELGQFQYYSAFRGPDLGDSRMGSALVPALEPGEEVTVSLNATLPESFLPPGSFIYVTSIGDLYFSFRESGLLLPNLFKHHTLDFYCLKHETDIKVELQTSDLTFDPEERIINYSVHVSNQGDEDAGNISVRYAKTANPNGEILDSNLSSGYTYVTGGFPFDHTWVIPELLVGESAQLDIQYQISEFALGALGRDSFPVDIRTIIPHITDTDPSNNQALEYFTPRRDQPSDLIDLELTIENDNPNIRIYKNGTITLTLHNASNRAATNSVVQLDRLTDMVLVGGSNPAASQGQFDGTIWRLPNLAAGATATASIQLFSLEDAFRLLVQVTNADQEDSDSTPDNANCCTNFEDDEAYFDNDAQSALPDLTIRDFDVPNTGQAATILRFPLVIQNIGRAAATADFRVGFYLSDDTNFSEDDQLIGEIPTGNLDLGNYPTTAAIALPDDAVGNKYLFGFIDPDQFVTESNENNNLFLLTAIEVTAGNTPQFSIATRQASIQIAPNPVKDQLFLLDNQGELQQYQIQSVAGKLLQTGSATHTIDVSDLASGLYFLSLEGGKTFRFVKD